MQKSTFSPLYTHLRTRLVEMRKEAGLSQRELAGRLGREHSFVGRVELGERRLDLVEFFWICKACDAEPGYEARAIMKEFAKLDRKRKTPR